MATLIHPEERICGVTAPGCVVETVEPDTVEGRRRRRETALQAIVGLWAGRTDISDGLDYQRDMRSEWR